MVRRALDPVSADAVLAGAIPPGPDGWVQVTIAYEDLDMAAIELLRLGSDVEVVEPLELRERMAATARAMVDRYALAEV
jgi:predicted DNA-binding transcriptional regulator YafY